MSKESRNRVRMEKANSVDIDAHELVKEYNDNADYITIEQKGMTGDILYIHEFLKELTYGIAELMNSDEAAIMWMERLLVKSKEIMYYCLNSNTDDISGAPKSAFDIPVLKGFENSLLGTLF